MKRFLVTYQSPNKFKYSEQEELDTKEEVFYLLEKLRFGYYEDVKVYDRWAIIRR